ncbi:unnamed protein product [Vitrella brassicaformis CCMP3155]|uniref:Eukaryotic translation initiation factor 3 subunit C n=1 Tax=Vitrella brassicaformis (strain CCMP3155) TaxID=1169540 RepID=A0A0G4ETH1_VITBC|nr:unnamed protein product [Vitrella brassicaformis CCMP3155]|eukprot:CEM01904.1 unnamed protein product [Vitrella brassicaformis CCMP3155]
MEAGSKFWAKGGGSSSEESEEESEEEEQQVQLRPGLAKWAVESSSDEDEKRVVRSARDKRFDEMRTAVHNMRNHIRIGDFSELLTDYEDLLKSLVKARQIVDEQGKPKFFVKAIYELEEFISTTYADRVAFKKLSKSKAIAFNTLRSKVRKGNEEFREDIDHCRMDPDVYDEDEEGGDEDEDESESEESDESEESSEEEGGGAKAGKDKDEDEEDESESEDESDWDDDENEEASDTEYADKHSKALAKWGAKGGGGEEKKPKKTEEEKKLRQADKKIKEPKKIKRERIAEAERDMENFVGFEAIDSPSALKKSVAEVIASRGRKGTDRQVLIKQLTRLLHVAEKNKLGIDSELLVLSLLISSHFDTASGVFSCLTASIWADTTTYVDMMVDMLKKNPGLCIQSVEGDEEAIVEKDESGKEIDAKARTFMVMSSHLERLDDELTKALQFTDVHTPEYAERLGQSLDFLTLLWKVYVWLKDTEKTQEVVKVALRILEQIYYKHRSIASRQWVLTKKRAQDKGWESANLLPDPEKAEDVVKELVQLVYQHGDEKARLRAMLYEAYQHSLHDRYDAAKDLLRLTNAQDLAMQYDVSVQILYNRNLVQAGLCAFRHGKIAEAHASLMEVCAQAKLKELLAQGMSNLRPEQRTPEQERAERRRQLPYHMHISLELIESVHHICAMLLEVPNLAMQPYQSLDTRKRVISKYFRKQLDAYEKQVFTGPPENPRETVMAATRALQKGNWQECCDYLFSLRIWELLPSSSEEEMKRVKANVTEHVKREALRTYLFTYSSLYESFALTQLSKMFDLPVKEIHRIVSKMMISQEIPATWDESSECILVHRIDPNPIQYLATQLAERVAQTVEVNERMAESKKGRGPPLDRPMMFFQDRDDRYAETSYERRSGYGPSYGGGQYGGRGGGFRLGYRGGYGGGRGEGGRGGGFRGRGGGIGYGYRGSTGGGRGRGGY